MKTITKQEFEKAKQVVKKYKLQCEKELTQIHEFLNNNNLIHLQVIGEDKLVHCGLSTRLLNGLYQTFDHTKMRPYLMKVSDLENISIKQLIRQRNIGRKSILELINFCNQVGVNLKSE